MSQNSIDLFSPFSIGSLSLPNRAVMAPMTRNRSDEGNIPNALMATYYKQRSAAGLIITEATQVCPMGQGYIRTPGIHSPEQIEGWKHVTHAVHQAGGRIFLQLWHVGRISHPDFLEGQLPVAPSAIAPRGVTTYTMEGPKAIPTPEPSRPLKYQASSKAIEKVPKTRNRPDSTESRSTLPTDISWTSFWKTAPTHGRIPTADPSKTGRG